MSTVVLLVAVLLVLEVVVLVVLAIAEASVTEHVQALVALVVPVGVLVVQSL